MTELERLEEILALSKERLQYTALSLGFVIVSFIAILALKKDWFPFWLLGEGGYFWAWNQARKITKEIRALENGGGRSNRN